MFRPLKMIPIVLTSVLVAAGAVTAQAQQIESELVLITPVAKTLTDPALAEFAKYAKEKWNITVRTSALAAGTPVAYGRIVEWKGRPEADIFWGGESALFDKLAEQKLIAKLDLPKAVVDSIPVSIGKPKPIPLKDPKGLLDRHGARAVRARLPPQAVCSGSACPHRRTGTICSIRS